MGPKMVAIDNAIVAVFAALATLGVTQLDSTVSQAVVGVLGYAFTFISMFRNAFNHSTKTAPVAPAAPPVKPAA